MEILTGLVILVMLPYIRMDQVSDTDELKLIREELSNFARRVEELENRDAARVKENEKLKTRIEELEARTQHQQEELDYLKSLQEESTDSHTDDSQLTDGQSLDSQITDAHSTDDIFTDSKSHNKLTNHKIHPQLAQARHGSNQTNLLQRIKNQVNSDSTVAFFSTMHAAVANTGSNQQLPFENVITNAGNGFNKYSGDFRVPVSGLYVFSTTITPQSGNSPHFYYVLNGRAISYFYSYYGSSTTEQAVLNLQVGDTVAVHSQDPGYRIDGNHYSTFSGFLLERPSGGVAAVGK